MKLVVAGLGRTGTQSIAAAPPSSSGCGPSPRRT